MMTQLNKQQNRLMIILKLQEFVIIFAKYAKMLKKKVQRFAKLALMEVQQKQMAIQHIVTIHSAQKKAIVQNVITGYKFALNAKETL